MPSPKPRVEPISPYAIRQIGLPDRALLQTAIGRFGRIDPTTDERVTEFVAAGNTWAFVAVDPAATTDPGGVLGWSWGSIQLDLASGRTSVMSGIEVAPDRRREGIGTFLLDAAFGYARRRRCSELRLAVDTERGADALRVVVGFVTSTSATFADEKVVRWAT